MLKAKPRPKRPDLPREQTPARIHQGRADRAGRKLDGRADEPVRPLRGATCTRASRTRNSCSATSPSRRTKSAFGSDRPITPTSTTRSPRSGPDTFSLLLRVQRVVQGARRGREIQGGLREVPRRLRVEVPARRRRSRPPRFVLVTPIAFEPTENPVGPCARMQSNLQAVRRRGEGRGREAEARRRRSVQLDRAAVQPGGGDTVHDQRLPFERAGRPVSRQAAR